MSSQVLIKLTREAINYNGDIVVFCWHGGEPTLAGVNFFEEAIGYQRQYATPGAKILNSIQTNGTLITERLADFFRDNNFNVGVSLDGSEYVHDLMRRDKKGDPCHSRTIRGIQILQEHKVKLSVIATVSKATLRFAAETFNYIGDLGFRNISYSPVFDAPDGSSPSVTSDEWYKYLRTVFHEWFTRGDQDIEVRELSEVISWISHVPMACCSSLGTCPNWLVIDYDGGIYPCEKLGKEICYGNVLTDDFATVVVSPIHSEFRRTNSQQPPRCRHCEFQKMCHNGCRQMRVRNGAFDPLGTYAYCDQRRKLYKEIASVFEGTLQND
jgi:uncharacterized protein